MIGRLAVAFMAFIVTALMVAPVTVRRRLPATSSEPDKSMANAQESFLKGNMNKAAEHIKKAAGYVRADAGKVAKDASTSVKKAGDSLDRLGGEVKRGSVKSADQLKKTFAQVDHSLAKAWHTTAEQAQKSGKDSTAALKKAGPGWRARPSGRALSWRKARMPPSMASRRSVRAWMGADDAGKFFKGIGEGIADLGHI